MKIDYGLHYRKWHPDTPEHQVEVSHYYKRILAQHLPQNHSARILELGCGMGFAMMTLKDLGYDAVEGVECDAGQAATCRKKGLKVALTEDTPGFLKSRASGFDLILAFDFLEHIPRTEVIDMVQTMYQALDKGGVFICTVPNANSVVASRWRYIDWTHHCSFTEYSLEFLLASGGFTDIEISEMEFRERPRIPWLPISGTRHWWAFRFFRFWQRLQMMAELGPAVGRTVPLSVNLFCTAKKA